MFPNEEKIAAELRAKHRLRMQRMDSLFRLALKIVSSGNWRIQKPRGLSRWTLFTILGLLSKTCKTVRGIQILSERGFHAEANVLIRAQFETALAILFILQKKSRQRTDMYFAYSFAQDCKMLNHWKTTPGLKRKASVQLQRSLCAERDTYIRKVPAGIDVEKHWSGKNILFAAKALGMEVQYATVYRMTSANTHATDFGYNYRLDKNVKKTVLLNAPTGELFDVANAVSRELLWKVLQRIDSRIGLGYTELIKRHEITKPALELEKWMEETETLPT